MFIRLDGAFDILKSPDEIIEKCLKETDDKCKPRVQLRSTYPNESEKVFGFDKDKWLDFPDNYEDIKQLFESEEFNMKFWLPRVLKIYDKDKCPIDNDTNCKRFPVPNPIVLLKDHTLDFGRVEVGKGESREFQVFSEETPIDVNLTISAPEIKKIGEPAIPTKMETPSVYEYEDDEKKINRTFLHWLCDIKTQRSGPVAVKFSPKTIKKLNAKLIIKHNADENGELKEIQLTGEGVEKGANSLKIDPQLHRFPDTRVKTKSKSKEIFVETIASSNLASHRYFIRR